MTEAQETSPSRPASAAPPEQQTAPTTETGESLSVQQLRDSWTGQSPPTSGQLIQSLLQSHNQYIDPAVAIVVSADEQLSSLGPARTVAEHLAEVKSCWDMNKAPRISGRHVILGLALDPGLGWQVLQDGIIGSLLTQWWPGLHGADEPHRVVWDVLSDKGRILAEEQPLLAAAYGAPAAGTRITLPAPVQAITWSPGSDRLAVLAGGIVYESRVASGPLHRAGALGGTVASIGWDANLGVVGLTVNDGQAALWQASEGTPVAGEGILVDRNTTLTVLGGVLSGDGSHAWLQTSEGVYRWAPTETLPTMIAPSTQSGGIPVAIDTTGQHGLVQLGTYSVLAAATEPQSPQPTPSGSPGPDWPDGAVPMIGWASALSSPYALVTLGRIAIAAAGPAGGIDVWYPAPSVPPATPNVLPQGQILVCHIASGPETVSTLAVAPNGTSLAMATGTQVAVWPLIQRTPATIVPAYAADRPDQSGDLLNAGRDAQAIAALVSARDVDPPLSIGLFGAWGSGKSFILREIIQLLTADERPEGYLRNIKVVEFNAWQYAETNLWASLVDQVLQVITPVRVPEKPPEVSEAAGEAEKASEAEKKARKNVVSAERQLDEAKRKLAGRRRRAAWLGATVLIVAAAAVVATLFGTGGKTFATASAALALTSAAVGLLLRAREAADQVGDLAEASRSGISVVRRLLGRPEELAVQAKAAELHQHQAVLDAAQAEAERLREAKQQIEDLAREQPLGALLHRLATINEYRDQLSLVTRTRDYFKAVDKEISSARERANAATPAGTGPASVAGAAPAPDGITPGRAHDLERVVVVIDDLDRCPPEKVVSVLEAVQLLFSFRMFVVLMAVDTSWLEQSLRIRYGKLVEGAASPGPADYLEKIIQVPLHLLPLDPSMVRAMISGLTGTETGLAAVARQADLGQAGQAEAEPSGREPVRANANGPVPGAPALTASVPRRPLKPLPAELMQVSGPEAQAMYAVAPLVGTTPRTVKRFVNSYRLLKTRLSEWNFDEPDGPLHVYETVAFLLAIVTGQPDSAGRVLSTLVCAPAGTSAEQALTNLTSALQRARAAPARAAGSPASNGSLPGAAPALSPDESASVARVTSWLATHRLYADAPAAQYAARAREVSRFSFSPPVSPA